MSGRKGPLSTEKSHTVQMVIKMHSELRCLTWEGDWSDDIVTEAAEKGRRGVYGKIVLTVCGEVG